MIIVVVGGEGDGWIGPTPIVNSVGELAWKDGTRDGQEDLDELKANKGGSGLVVRIGTEVETCGNDENDRSEKLKVG